MFPSKKDRRQLYEDYGMSALELAMLHYNERGAVLCHTEVVMVDQKSPEGLATRHYTSYNMSVEFRAPRLPSGMFRARIPLANAAMQSLGNVDFVVGVAACGAEELPRGEDPWFVPVLGRMWLEKEDLTKERTERDKLSLQRSLQYFQQCLERGVHPICSIPVDGGKEWVNALVKAGAAVLSIDTLKLATHKVVMLIKWIKQTYPDVTLIAGNTSNPSIALKFALDYGLDGVKIGYGPGAVCSTCRKTGHGSAQFSATCFCADVIHVWAEKFMEKWGRLPLIIPDGGIKESGHLIRLLGAMGNPVDGPIPGFGMIGTGWAGTDASGLGKVKISGRWWMAHWGQASKRAIGEEKDKAPEGAVTNVPYKGPLSDLLVQWRADIATGFGAAGVLTLDGLVRKGRYLHVSDTAASTNTDVARLQHEAAVASAGATDEGQVCARCGADLAA